MDRSLFLDSLNSPSSSNDAEEIESDQPDVSGILSQRLFHSPIIQKIHAARIRSKHQNDVVFISETAVYLKEVTGNGQLQDIATKDDFHCRICDSRVLGECDGLVELEKMDVESVGQLPPQILVLTLDSEEMLMLYAIHRPGEPVRFVTHARPLPMISPAALIVRGKSPGKHIAIDPRSRAIAVAQAEDGIIFYKLRPPDNARASLENLVISDNVVRTGLCVHAMEFLYQCATNADRIDLVLYGTKDGKRSLLSYSWDFSGKTAAPAQVHMAPSPGVSGSNVFTVMAPLKLAGSFLLVSNRYWTVCQLKDDGSFHLLLNQSYEVLLGPDLGFEDAGSGSASRYPLWTSWASTLPKQEHGLDSVYLAREDGFVLLLSLVKHRGKVKFITEGPEGYIDTHLEGAVSLISLCSSGREALVISGTNGCGGVYEVDHEGFNKIQEFQNWAPSASIAVMSLPPGLGNRAECSTISNRQRLFATSGRGPYGAVSELRYGREIRMVPIEALTDLFGTNRVWLLSSCNTDQCHLLLCSFPWKTTLFRTIEGVTVAIDTADKPILAAMVLGDLDCSSLPHTSENSHNTSKRFIQVTANDIEVYYFQDLGAENEGLHLIGSWPMHGSLVAAIELISADTTFVVLAVNHEQATAIHMKRMTFADGKYQLVELGTPVEIESEPTCASMFWLTSDSEHKLTPAAEDDKGTHTTRTIYSAIGTASGAIHIFGVDGSRGLRRQLQIPSPRFPHDPSSACESLSSVSPEILVPADPSLCSRFVRRSVTFLLCGFRNGKLMTNEIGWKESTEMLRVVDSSITSFGVTPVDVTADTKQEAVYVSCGSELCCIEFNARLRYEPKVSSIYCINDETGSTLPSVKAFCPVAFRQPGLDSYTEYQTGLGRSEKLFCISDGKALVGYFTSSSAKPLPKQMPIEGSPGRILYSSHLDALIVTSTIIETEVNAQGFQTRFPLSTVSLIDKSLAGNSLGVDDFEGSAVRGSFTCAPGERISSLIEWLCEQNGLSHHFLIATVVKELGKGQVKGGLKFLKVHTHSTTNWTISVSHDSAESQPIVSACQYGSDSLVYGSGYELRLRRFNSERKGFDQVASHRLGSAARHITVTDWIYVTTAEHSLLAFDFAGGQFRRVFSEDRARSGLSHVNLAHKRAVLVSDKDCNVICLVVPKELSKAVSACAEVELPCSITHLVKAHIRPSWKHGWEVDYHERDVFGTASDGSLFCFSILSGSAWRLLTLIQVMCMVNPRLCPHRSPTIMARLTNLLIRPTAASATNYHVDGDILNRLIELPDAPIVLSNMLLEPSTVVDLGSFTVKIIPTEKKLAFCQQQFEKVLAESESSNMLKEIRSGNLIHDLLRFIGLVLETPF